MTAGSSQGGDGRAVPHRRWPVSPSIADRTVEELGGWGSVLARQRRAHVELGRLLAELERARDAAQVEVLARIGRLVFTHAFAEEAVLWPVLRRVLPDGDELTRRVEREHQEVNDLVSALERGGLRDRRRPDRLARLVALLREDVRDEEEVLLPRLRERLGDDELRRLGRAWELTRRLAPTRAHPAVSRRPPGNALSALPLSTLDRTRDLVDAGVRCLPLLAPAGRVTDQVLAGLTGLVELLPPARC